MNDRVILIVEEEEIQRLIYRAVCESVWPRAEIIEAANGKAALESVRADALHAVITDMNMPVMNGVEMLLRLRCQGFAGPALIISGASIVHDPLLLPYSFYRNPMRIEELKRELFRIEDRIRMKEPAQKQESNVQASGNQLCVRPLQWRLGTGLERSIPEMPNE